MLPSVLRDELKGSELKETVYVNFYPGTFCLTLSPYERWKNQIEKYDDEGRFSGAKLMSAAQRLYFSNVEKVTIDKTGRLLLPATFREKAKISREVIILGVLDKIELWDPQELDLQEAKDLVIFEAALAEEANRSQSNESFKLPQW